MSALDDKPFESMNMVPFIDIMLVLLTIVLTTSSFIASGRIAVNLPQASASQQEPQKPPETLEIDAQGRIYRDGIATSTELLRQSLAALPHDTAFLLRADKAVALQSFVDVADLLKQLGFSKVAVQTDTVSRRAGGP